MFVLVRSDLLGQFVNTSFMQRFGRQHVNGSQTLLRSARNQLHTTLPLI